MNSNVNRLLFVMAQNLHHSGQSNLAISIYRRYVGLEPNDVEGLMGLGELLFELNEPDEACEMHERAISLDPQRVDLRLTFMRQLIKNNQLDQVDKVIGGVLQQLPARRDCLLRHTQLVLKRMPDRTIQVIQFLVRIGDLVALMICAEYMKRYEGRRIIFQLMDKTHKSLKADVLFKNTIDQVVTVEGPDFGFGNPEGPAVYDPGSLWIATTFYHGRYGGQVIPRLHLDPSQYLGPEMEWGKYVVFSPLFDPPYNKPRGMDEAFVNELCDKLYSAVGERAIVITNQPERIYSKIRTISTDNLYDLVYLIGKSKVYLGGDTGFTHFAAAGRVEHLFALYGANYAQDFPSALTNLCFDDTIYAFTAPGKYWGANWDCRPKCDLSKTDLHFHTLQNNRLPMLELDSIIQQVQDILSE